MIVERTEHPTWTSNAYLVADREGGHAVLIDGNGVVEPLIEQAEQLGVTVDAILITHHHGDHIEGVDAYRERYDVPVYAHPWTKDEIAPDVAVDETYDEGDVLTFGDLRIEVLHTPGHAAGHVALLVNGTDVFTADVLFKGTVGGSFAPGNTGYDDLKASVLRMVDLPPETVVHPGHTLPTTAGEEAANNPFVRIWRGVDPEGDEQVTVWGREATLVLWAPDYDGTNKAWVRFADDGADGIVGGSQVERQ
jgi:glyoxylase-like metal-dependent hydrolase (beta-lactamase superfamily II)